MRAKLLKLFNADIPEVLEELKNIIAGFLLEKAPDKADSIWIEKGYTDEKLLHLLGEQ